jgi:hypothetical protein
MAGGITYRKEDGFVFFSGCVKCLLAPGEPVNRIVGVLEEVGALFGE